MKRKTLVFGLAVLVGLVIGLTIAVKTNIFTTSQSQNTISPSDENIPIENATIRVAKETGRAVVSIGIEQIIKEPSIQYYYSGPKESPFGNDENMKKFFENFFGGMPRGEQREMGLGSGVIIDERGYVLTNAHVVDKADKITVTLPDGRQFKGEVKGRDERSDLAIVKINANNLPVAVLGDSNKLEIGQWVVAIGNPFGFSIRNHEPTVTVGVVSALHRSLAASSREGDYNDLIQTDAAINPGNSGGPLVNLKGEVIGINVAIFTTSGGYQGVGFALPINIAKRIMSRLIEGKKIIYGWLGVTVQDLSEDLARQFGLTDTKGALVANVLENSPAAKAGIKAGDVIRKIDDTAISNVRELLNSVERLEVGRTVSVGIFRQGKQSNLEVQITARPENLEELASSQVAGKWRGLSVDNLTPQNMQKFGISEKGGVVITAVDPGSAADYAGLSIGDVILEINKEKVGNLADYQKITGALKGDALVLTGKGFFVVKGSE